MSNLFKTISLNRSTTIYSISSLILWLGLTLAILGADPGAAIAKPAQSRASTPDPAEKDQSSSTPTKRRLNSERRSEPTASRADKPSRSLAPQATPAIVKPTPPVHLPNPILSAAPAAMAIRVPAATATPAGETPPRTTAATATPPASPRTITPRTVPSRTVPSRTVPSDAVLSGAGTSRAATAPISPLRSIRTRTMTTGDRFVSLPEFLAQLDRLPTPASPNSTQNPFIGGGTTAESMQPSSTQASSTQPSTTLSPAPAPSQTAPVQSAQRVNPESEPESTTASDLGPVTDPILRVQGAYFLEGDEDSVRARIIGVYPLSPQVQLGAVIDVTDDGVFNLFEDGGVDITELYVAAAPFDDLPGLRFVAGQIDLTSYFDRNSFAKDRTTHFFNSVFQTNPALAAANLVSRPGVLVNWTITDNVEVRAAGFSADPDIGDFAFDSFAGEVGFRIENFIIRGTYVNSEDSGANTGFEEIFGIDRGSGSFGLREGDQEEAWGVNAEYFIPEIRMGLFGRYGHYQNQSLNLGADTFMAGVNFLDVFMRDDRIGLGYGRLLSNADLRGDETPDVWELFYDARVHPNFRVGAMIQQRNEFSETFAGFRIRADFDLLANRRRASQEDDEP